MVTAVADVATVTALLGAVWWSVLILRPQGTSDLRTDLGF